MKGKWTGFYQYKDESTQRMLGVDRTYFTIIIDDFDGEYFSGEVEDDLDTKGTPGIGQIQGQRVGDEIRFLKHMPIHATLNMDGNTSYNEKEKHPPIYYEGKLVSNGNIFQGSWEMKTGFTVFGFFIHILSTHGTWQMRKEF